jgi:hypothetical protein
MNWLLYFKVWSSFVTLLISGWNLKISHLSLIKSISLALLPIRLMAKSVIAPRYASKVVLCMAFFIMDGAIAI